MTDLKAILCIDIDGTLIGSNETIHPNDVETLSNFPKSVQPILTTGRSLFSAKGILYENGLFTSSPIPLAGVFMNGGAAYLPNEVLCIHHIFSSTIRDDLIALAEKNPQSTFIFFSLDAGYVVNPNEYGQYFSNRNYLNPHLTTAEEVPEEIVKVMVVEKNRPVIEKIARNAAGLSAEMAYSLSHLYEINPLGITKAQTLTKLIDKMELTGVEIYAVGDGENDLSLFELSKASFTPASAHPSILEKADHVIKSENNGLLLPILNSIDAIQT